MDELLKKIKGYEKFLSSVLGMLLVFILCYKFVFCKQMEKRERLLSEIDTVSFKYDLQEENKRNVEEIAKKFKEYKENLTKIRENYPPVMQYEELMFLYQDFMNKIPYNFNGVSLSLYNTIKGPSISSEELIKQITDEDVLKKAYEMGFITDTEEYRFQDAQLEDGSAYGANYSVTITGTMDKVWGFLDLMRNYKPKVAMTSFSLTGHEDGTVTAPINFSILGIMDKHVVGYSMLEKNYWNRTKISGKDNLFVRTDATGTVTTDNKAKYTADKADFGMRLIAYTEGVTPQTVLLGIQNPKGEFQGAAEVYGDNKAVERVDIYVEEKEDKFFTKIKTQSNSFPDEEYEELVEFEPKGDDLFLYITSSDRLNDEDESGVDIHVENKTDRKFVIKIKYDPEDRPRVSYEENENIVVYKENEV
ncbi:MAG: hypothetical protein J6Y29_07155 [Clostridiales bacterium]|nr:hypothetical protein [Clostridiales bacterium]